jgi:hypothetical protein
MQVELLPKTNSVTQGNNVLDIPHSNVHDFLLRDIYSSSTQLNMPFWNKVSVFALEKPDGQAIFLTKTHSIVTQKQCARCSTFYHRQFSFKRYICFINSDELAY